MSILYLDFETYYDSIYSLRNMSPAEYILDPRYETILCAVAVDNQPSRTVSGRDFPNFISQFNPATTDTVAFNATFDNSILAWKYGFVPRRIYCSMALARTLRGHLLASASLASVVKLLGLRDKGTALLKTIGMHGAQIQADPNLWREFCEYADLDNELSREIFVRLIPELPTLERHTMDQVIRCCVEPRLVADTALLESHLAEVRREKNDLLQLANAPMEEFSSTPKFVAMLEKLGVEVEYKTSPKGNTIPCFAKTDAFMEELQGHPDEMVRAAAMARLGVRSTIEETRGQRMLSITRLPWPVTVRGNMPIPLRIAGAHTLRLSGDWRMNMQNLPAGRGGSTSQLRASLRGRAGERVVVGDLSQIECRLNAWFCGETGLLQLFRDKQDPYLALASLIFGYPCNKKDHPIERFIGKTGELGLGFGCGHEKFYTMVWRMARQLKMTAQIENIWTPELADKSVKTYRNTHPNIKAMWRLLGEILHTAWLGGAPRQVGPVTIREGEVIGPGGLTMRYKPIQPNEDPDLDGRSLLDVQLRFLYGGRSHRIYGAKFLENIIQFLARIVIMAAADRLYSQGLKFVMQTHDELVFLVPEAETEAAKALIYKELTRPPYWALDLPVDAEVGDGETYGDAK